MSLCPCTGAYSHTSVLSSDASRFIPDTKRPGDVGASRATAQGHPSLNARQHIRDTVALAFLIAEVAALFLSDALDRWAWGE